ncbi:MAG: hypothetical protein QOE36_578 [Gaiellaceae bacterium]|jgi:quercetin dioxygenase-like cupin family protein|nr:hypothetical protein [Gaiellaceae bacterium]
MAAQLDTSLPYVLGPGAGEPMSWFSATITLKASSPELGVCEILIGPGDEPPMHVHSRDDEWFYVLEGEATFHVGDESHRAAAGAFVSFPRRVPHTFTVESPTARFLLLNTPGGFERMFELAPKTVEEAVRAFTEHDIEVVGPHPRETGSA